MPFAFAFSYAQSTCLTIDLSQAVVTESRCFWCCLIPAKNEKAVYQTGGPHWFGLLPFLLQHGALEPLLLWCHDWSAEPLLLECSAGLRSERIPSAAIGCRPGYRLRHLHSGWSRTARAFNVLMCSSSVPSARDQVFHLPRRPL